MEGTVAHARKKELRQRIRSRRRTLSADHPARSELNAQVSALIESVMRKGAHLNILAYASIAHEPSIDDALDQARTNGARVYLPVVTGAGEPLMFGEATVPMKELTPAGTWGIREPRATVGAEQLVSDLGLALIPGLSFSTEGDRLGNGGGFYDRTFGPQGVAPLLREPGHHLPLSVGVCFEAEYGEKFPVAAWDLRVDAVVTEEGLHTV
ncbi:5-formyltetrahydrofolate cyclo-ligase [Brevibacterium sp. UMB1308A]|uniref:5-formyltetrahydrofolate cyclo-ligase n=1 Tax=Brevibacterium sp. UMB1308A TaxID=3050608 RepID=UPI0025515371|nr:5-formyltetrahydrofolate cyclo-ligase [Brevibacterium sp. UMB1308A]MDK8347372.1 5-formyltetrahydrofolate cyclo-ligase [Brevibacterium sp. UMB1308B]MDK8712532.1 5-formyltetrahydrofolate cyclo-ligase [Brevibacterium sp. UMB1308A]